MHHPADINRQRVLTDDSHYDEWPRWFKKADAEYALSDARHFTDDNMLLQAAIAGQGVTLARAIIAQDDLDAGRLVRPFDINILSVFQYYFVCPPDRLSEPGIQAFRTWLQQAMN